MTKLQKFQAALSDMNAEGAVISSELNQRYLTDFSYSDGYLLVTPRHAYLLTDFRYAEAAHTAVPEWEVVVASDGMFAELGSLIRQEGIHRIALEDATLPLADYQKMQDAFSNCTLLSGASAVLSRLRAVKTAEELEKIACAQAITDRAFSHILSLLSPKMTEKEVAWELEFFMRKNGAEDVAFPTIAVSGPASSLPHGVPSDQTLRPGFLTMDFGAKADGYCSDMTRTVVIGKADAEMKRIYQTVLAAQTAALEQIREGMPCRSADKIARDIIGNAGYGTCFGHSLGHGVGLFIHEAPNLSPRAAESSVLVRGNVVTVEPGIYIEGTYGCRIEDMIAIDENGAVRNFTHSPKELLEL